MQHRGACLWTKFCSKVWATAVHPNKIWDASGDTVIGSPIHSRSASSCTETSSKDGKGSVLKVRTRGWALSISPEKHVSSHLANRTVQMFVVFLLLDCNKLPMCHTLILSFLTSSSQWMMLKSNLRFNLVFIMGRWITTTVKYSDLCSFKAKLYHCL